VFYPPIGVYIMDIYGAYLVRKAVEKMKKNPTESFRY
jgi:hypothetical protein